MENKKIIVANLKMDMNAQAVGEYLKNIVGKIFDRVQKAII